MSLFPYDIFARLMATSPLQPATNIWRAVELDALIEHALPRLREARRILDLGCGNGRTMRILRPYLPPYAVLSGIDSDRREVDKAEALGLYEDLTCADIEMLPYETASFDVVIANSVLEHIGPVRTVLGEVARVLKPGGSFIVTVPGPDFHACLCGGEGTVCRAYFEQLDTRLIHLRYWSLAQWVERLMPLRLSLIDSHEYLNEAEARRWHALSKLTGGLLFRLTGRRKMHRLSCPVYRTCAVASVLPLWVRLLSRAMLWRFKEPEAPLMNGCLMLVVRRDLDPYERAPD